MRAEWELPDEFDVYIFDCMRPLNLASVHGCNDVSIISHKFLLYILSLIFRFML
jgi:hypothetical protein